MIMPISPALADKNDAEACSKKLMKISKKIYDVAIKRAIPGAVDQNTVMFQEIISEMIDKKELSMHSAPIFAMPAVECLRKINIGHEIK